MPSWTWTENIVADQDALTKPDSTGRNEDGVLVSLPVKNGMTDVVHFSGKKGLEVLDPEFYGNKGAGAERQRMNSPNWINRIYYGIEPGTKGGYIKESVVGNNQYKLSLPSHMIYDFQTDPDNIREGLEKNTANNYEKAIHDAGYMGYFVKHPKYGMVGISFDPIATNADVFNQPGAESTEARKRRAKDQGFDVDNVLYRVQAAEHIDGSIVDRYFSSDSKDTSDYMRDVVGFYEETPVSIPVFMNTSNFKVEEDINKVTDYDWAGDKKKKLIAEGYTGIMDSDRSVVVPFTEVVVRSVNAQFNDPDSANLLAQPDDRSQPRGYYDPANSIIRLNESSNLSTFLHEFGHFMYEMERGNNSDLLQSINSWYKRNAESVLEEATIYETNITMLKKHLVQFLDTGAVSEPNYDDESNQRVTKALRRAVHEQFARGFETYLMEGKAPSVELRNAFRTFARWLVQIYKAIRGDLNVSLDDQMRKVFDRLLATEDQIAAAEARGKYEPMFTDAAMAGMTEEQFAKYKADQEKVKDVQTETLRDKIIKQLTRQTEAWWKEEKQDIVDSEMGDLAKEKVHNARTQLTDGTLKLDHATVKEMVGAERTNKLGRKSTVIPQALIGKTAKGQDGVHPDDAAAFLGYNSGSEMINDLINAPSLKEAADTIAEAAMVERHGDILNDGTIQKEADDAVQNEARGKLLLTELRALAKGTAVPITDRQTIKTLAEDNIGKLSFRQIHPGKYRKAEIRAAQESATMLATEDREGAAEAKRRQVMNYYLGMAATNAKNETMKIVDRMTRYNKKSVREAIVKAEGGYWDQLVKILQRFEFRKAATLGQVESLNTWLQERVETIGDGLVISDQVMNESYVTHWKNVPFTDLQGINDSVKNIEHVAKYSNKISLLQEKVDFKTMIDKLVTHITSVNKSTYKPAEAIEVTKDNETLGWGASQMTKIPWLVRELDGGEAVGLVHEVIMEPINKSAFDELGMMETNLKSIYDLIENRHPDDRARHNRTIYIPELEGTATGTKIKGHQVLAVALNVGNKSNLRKLILGERWGDIKDDSTITMENPKLDAVLNYMTESDWVMVQTIWNQMELLYPQLSEVYKKTTGQVPTKVEASPFTVTVMDASGTPKDITLDGGYYPVKGDRLRSAMVEKNEQRMENNVESMFNVTGGMHASVSAGATNERTGAVFPLKLSLEVVPEHFQEVIHFITHHDAVRQLNKIITNEEFRAAVRGVVGKNELNTLKPWLSDVAKAGRSTQNKSFIDAMFAQLRMGTTLGVMGFSTTTGVVQALGVFNSIAELGVKHTFEGYSLAINRGYVFKAVRDLMGSENDLQSGMEFALEKSKVLPYRIKTMDREMASVFREIGQNVDIKSDSESVAGFAVNSVKALRRSKVLRKTQEVSMLHIAIIQMYSVDLPAWHAAYSKGISEWNDEARAIRYADWTVENTQGSGATKDMAALIRNQSKIHTSFTMFMTFFSTFWNVTRGLGRDIAKGRVKPGAAAAKMAFLYFIPTFVEMLARDQFLDEDDEDEFDVLQRYLLRTAMYPAQSVPFFRDIASGATSDYGYSMNPVAGLLEKGVEGGRGLTLSAFDDSKDISLYQLKSTTRLMGAWLGVPGLSQVWRTGEHLYDVAVIGEDLTFKELSFGPKRE